MYGSTSANSGTPRLTSFKAIRAFQRTRPWILLFAVLATLGVGCGLLVALAFLLSPSAIRPDILIIPLVLAVWEGLFAILFYRFATAISQLTKAGSTEVSIAFERVCKRQFNLWMAIAIVSMLSFFLPAIDLIIFLSQSI